MRLRSGFNEGVPESSEELQEYWVVLDEIQHSMLHRWDLALNVPLLRRLLHDITQY